jgi:tRNA(adenine34) deaminase
MNEALKEARLALEYGEVPVGAVVVRGGEIISRAHNEVETRRDPSAHAELLALSRAAEALNDKFLSDCVLYVTLEPCPMCAGACLNYRIGAVAFGAFDPRAGAMGSVTDIGSGLFGQEIPVFGGILREECAGLLTECFREKR